MSVSKYKIINGTGNCNTTNEARLQEYQKNYNLVYNNQVSSFNILISTSRAEEAYVNLNANNKIKMLIDLDRTIGKTDLNPVIKEMRCTPNLIKTGDYITLTNKYSGIEDCFIITSKIERKDGYDLCYIQYCNNMIKFKNKYGALKQYPIILSNQTLYSDGMDEGKVLTMSDTQRGVLVQYNDDTINLYLQQRFIFNSNSIFNISMIDDYTYFYGYNQSNKNGILKLTMKTDSFKDSDDKINNLADNNVLPITLTFPQTQYTISTNSILTLTPTLTQGDKSLLLTDYPVLWSVDTPTVASVENGVITGLSVGTCKVTCKLQGNEEILANVDLVVANSQVPSYEYKLEGKSQILFANTETFVARVYQNGLEIPNQQFDFSIDYNGVLPNSISTTIVSNNTIKIKNINAKSGAIRIIAQDKNSDNRCELDVQLKGLW